MSKIKSILPGLIVSIIVGLISIFISTFIPKLGAATISIFLGMFIGNIFLNQDIFQSGYKFSESDLLSYSIVLLGATLNVTTLMALGWNGLLYIVLQMSTTLAACLIIGKKLGFKQNFRYLMASGNSVCGSSAIAATAPVINADDKEKGIVITIVNVTGIFLMFLLPLISKFLYNYSELESSALIGGILQSVGQVVASGAMISPEIKDLATIFKIVRVILLVFVVLLFGHLKHKHNEEILEEEVEEIIHGKVKVPWYVFGFFITCALFSLNIISSDISVLCKSISNKLEIFALAAIGLRVNIKELIQQGKAISLYGLYIGIVQIISALLLIWVLF